ncbi:membrane protein [Rhodococcoides trifolii]|uniref:Membrane protein n=2 Tax=Rhodococcoides trifolii TaxID=908250 RepID=A0A917D0Z6_9NOCA|nr:membrane protein [Rhodococcus trifolii]
MPESTSADGHEQQTVQDDKAIEKVDATQLLLDNLGGTSGMIYTAIPVVAFVTASALVALPIAVGVAIAIALVVTVLRLKRGEPIAQASGGLLGVVVAGGVAAWTGSAGGYFLIGIWLSLGGAALMLISILARRPLTGLLWNALHGNEYAWRSSRSVVRAHYTATTTFVVLFGARYVVQDWLYDTDATGWLAFARIAMGTPLLALAILVTVWAFRRSTAQLVHSNPA